MKTAEETDLTSQPGWKLVSIAARVGYGARGVVYLLVGLLAVLAAFDLGGGTVGTRGALRVVLAQPFGPIMLAVLSAGFACLALWRLIQAFLDPANYGHDLKGLGIRAALGGSALAYLGIAAFALRLTLGWVAANPPDHRAPAAWLSELMMSPTGPWIIGSAGLGIVGMGLFKMAKAWRADLGEHLECSARVQRWAIPISRFGLTARGAIFLLIGVLAVIAAVQVEVDRTAGLAGVLALAEQSPLGWILLAIIALGLTAFGIFGLIEAIDRRIIAQDID